MKANKEGIRELQSTIEKLQTSILRPIVDTRLPEGVKIPNEVVTRLDELNK